MLEHFISQHGGAGLGHDCLVVRETFFPVQWTRPLCNSSLCLDQVQGFPGTNTEWGLELSLAMSRICFMVLFTSA